MMAKVKKQILNRIKNGLHKKGYKISRLGNINFFDQLIFHLYKKNNGFNFIQIGANDGKRFDPLYNFIKNSEANIYGFVVEPIPYYFNKLKRNYQSFPNIVPINVAIHNSKKEMTIYRSDFENFPNLPEFAHGIGSFSKEHHKKTNIPDVAIIEEQVNCISLKDLIEKYQISEIDLLLIDTEGYDAEIILNIDFNSFAPKVIHFEHGLKVNTMSENQFKEVVAVLEKHQYSIFIESSDATAYKKNILVEHLVSFENE